MAKLADNRTDKRKIGDIGENIACQFLVKRGFEIIERNYLRKWGEIDIVARKAGIMRFVEVKTVRLASTNSSESRRVTHVTPVVEQSSLRGKPKAYVSDETYRPEDNMHPWKLKRLGRTIQTYMLHKKQNCDWQLDLITVKMDMAKRQARVEMIENIVI